VFLTGSLAFALLVIRCRTEEANLIARFGDAYRAYAVETGRFLPRLGRWGAGMMSLRRR
jgi:protein-S-isoprenylcysteine O-methyltransferase Ste14